MKNLKKIMMGLIVLAVGFVSFSFADCLEPDEWLENCQTKCSDTYTTCVGINLNNPDVVAQCKKDMDKCRDKCEDDALEYECTEEEQDNTCSIPDCPDDKIYDSGTGCACCINGVVQSDTENPGKKACVQNYYGTMGLDINTECLKNGQCHMNVYRTLGIRKSDDDPEVQTFVQDIILGATEFIGTVITVVLMVSGLFYIISAMTGKTELSGRAKKAMIGSIVGLLFVTLSYSIIRLIQFLATGGS